MTIRTLVFWTPTEIPGFEDRYRAEHIPLVRALPGLTEFVLSPTKSRAASHLAELSFADEAAMRGAFASEAGVALVAHTAELEQAFGTRVTRFVVLEPIED